MIKQEGIFHVFWGREVVKILEQHLKVENSKARGPGQVDDQKVIFKASGKTCGEVEMRNDSDVHYREVKFWLDKKLIFGLLKSEIKQTYTFNNKIILYGEAINKLAKPPKKKRGKTKQKHNIPPEGSLF